MYISFNLSDQVKFNTTQVEVSRYILDIAYDNNVQNIFKTFILDKPNISFTDFNKLLNDKKIKHILDNDIINLRTRDIQYHGKFIAQSVYFDDVNIDTGFKKSIKVKLDKLTTDKTSTLIDTINLKN